MILISFSFFPATSQNYSTDDVQLINVVDKLFKENHVEYENLFPKIRARFSTQFIKEIDPDSRYFTINDIERIRSSLGEFSISHNYTRKQLESLRELVSQRLTATKKILRSINSIDFFEDDSVFLQFKYDSTAFSRNDEDLYDRWVKFFKFEVLLKKRDTLLTSKSQSDINSILNEELLLNLESSICYIDQLLKDKILNKYVLQAYLKAYCKSFDPHSDFFSRQQGDLFVESLSSKSYGTGLRVGKDGNKLLINEIIPFSNASLNKNINVGDEITGIEINDEIIAPLCVSNERLNEFFYGDKNTNITFEFKSNKDLQFRKVQLSKSVLNNNFNHTYSFILKNENIDIGYVQFPSFYRSYTIDGRSASEDLALILLEFKKRSLDGVILDLRNNGGGSIKEASDLLGYFIDYGPLFTIVDKENPEGKLVKDTKRGKVIDSKIIFLVNGLSASASELVASTMQKYPQSIVVGSPTFGKATGQSILPVQTKYAKENQGIVSITSIKSYRFDGTNYQGTGVIPDILLPDLLSKAIVSEENYQYTLSHNRKRKFRQIKYRDEPIDTLRSLSRKRDNLANIKSVDKDLRMKLFDHHGLSLNYETFESPYLLLQPLPSTPHDHFEIETMEENEAFIEESDRIKNNKQKDVVLKEVFQIFEDWIRITN